MCAACAPVLSRALRGWRISILVLLTFTKADHSFFNDAGARFNPHAATEAWRRALNWFDAASSRRD